MLARTLKGMNLGAELSWLGQLSDLAREIITRRRQAAVLHKLEAAQPILIPIFPSYHPSCASWRRARTQPQPEPQPSPEPYP